MFSRRLFLTALAASPLLARPALAAAPDIFAQDGLAIRGADPVGYFTDHAPVAGVAAFALMWRGAYWHFASAENRARFEADPAAFAPQYGGYGAYAVANGAIATTVPEAWTIFEGKLYLNHSEDMRRVWLRDITGNIALADANWPAILQS